MYRSPAEAVIPKFRVTSCSAPKLPPNPNGIELVPPPPAVEYPTNSSACTNGEKPPARSGRKWYRYVGMNDSVTPFVFPANAAANETPASSECCPLMIQPTRTVALIGATETELPVATTIGSSSAMYIANELGSSPPSAVV